MLFQLSAACGCTIGRVRSNNEDNLYFDGISLPEYNNGLSGCVVKKVNLEGENCFAVYDGMGGESYGEKASYIAAVKTKEKMNLCKQIAIGPRTLLKQLCKEINHAICDLQNEVCANRIGTTGAFLLFVPDEAYACNLGDSRIYRLRDDEFLQISVDDVERVPEGVRRKGGLTQYLGVPEDELEIEPHIIKCELRKGDTFVICSDGLTDMLTNLDICMILRQHISVKRIAQHLIIQAMKNGGRDNTTVIVIRVE